MTIKLECIWCNNKAEFNRHVRLNGEGACVINYLDIVNKLVKADPYGSTPNDKVIGLHLLSSLENVFKGVDEDTKEVRIIYMLKNLTEETADGLFDVIQDLSLDNSRLGTKLVIINRTDYPRKGVLSKFDVVKFIDK
jgi:hypothetical protein